MAKAKGLTLPEMQAEALKRIETLVGAWNDKPAGLSKDLVNAYRTAYKAIDARIKESYAKVLTGVSPEDYLTEMSKRKRLETLQKDIKSLYTKGSISAQNIHIESSKIGITNGFYDNMFSANQFTSQIGAAYFSNIPTAAVNVSVYGTPKIWNDLSKAQKALYKNYQPRYGTLMEVITSNRTKDLIKIQQSITQSLIQGRSYTKTTEEIKKIMNTTTSNALRIARTETMRNYNAGSSLNSLAMANSNIPGGRMYVATLDTRTREQSSSMDGQRVSFNEPFTFPNGVKGEPGNSGVARYDINDRCTSVDIIDGIPPETRTARGEDGKSVLIDYTTHDQWMKDNGLKYNSSGRIVSV